MAEADNSDLTGALANTLSALREAIGSEKLASLPPLELANFEGHVDRKHYRTLKLRIGKYAGQNAGRSVGVYAHIHTGGKGHLIMVQFKEGKEGEPWTRDTSFNAFNREIDTRKFHPDDVFEKLRKIPLKEEELKALAKYYFLLAVESGQRDALTVEIPYNNAFRTHLKRVCNFWDDNQSSQDGDHDSDDGSDDTTEPLGSPAISKHARRASLIAKDRDDETEGDDTEADGPPRKVRRTNDRSTFDQARQDVHIATRHHRMRASAPRPISSYHTSQGLPTHSLHSGQHTDVLQEAHSASDRASSVWTTTSAEDVSSDEDNSGQQIANATPNPSIVGLAQQAQNAVRELDSHIIPGRLSQEERIAISDLVNMLAMLSYSLV